MTVNIYYDDKKAVFVMYYQGKRYERASKSAALELAGTFMSDMFLNHLYQAA